jgi:hypothetical protein
VRVAAAILGDAIEGARATSEGDGGIALHVAAHGEPFTPAC